MPLRSELKDPDLECLIGFWRKRFVRGSREGGCPRYSVAGPARPSSAKRCDRSGERVSPTPVQNRYACPASVLPATVSKSAPTTMVDPLIATAIPNSPSAVGFRLTKRSELAAGAPANV